MTVKIKTQIANKTNFATEEIDFGVLDSKGRKIGALIWLDECDFVEVAADSMCYTNMPVGHYFTFRPTSARNGESFGALQPRQYFKTDDERREAIVKYLRGAEKRSTKLAA